MKKNIRPITEQFEYAWIILLYLPVWIADIYTSYARGAKGEMDSFFFILGVMVLGYGVMKILIALKTRREHDKIKEQVTPVQGKILRCIYKEEDAGDMMDSKSKKRRNQRFYFLQIEIPDETRGSIVVESDPYTKPIHEYLKSDRVSVYTPANRSVRILDHFDWKDAKDEPNVIPYDGPKQNPLWGIVGNLFVVATMLFLAVVIYVMNIK